MVTTLSDAQHWDKLTAGMFHLGLRRPSEKALRELRRRLGEAPLRMLFETVAGPVAQPGTPGVCYRGWRTVAFDGCSSSKAPDLPSVSAWLGKLKHRYGSEGYPMLKIVALCETGTRALLGAVFGLVDVAEHVHAEHLLPLLDAKMLLLNDRGFDSDEFLSKIAGTGAHMLVRLRGRRSPARWAHLPDGTYLTRIAGVRLRIIDAHVSATTVKGLRVGERYLLATTLTDHRRHPATELIALYHERWEIESAFYALRHTLQRGLVLRSQHPIGLAQELWAQLTVYQLLRRAMADAVESRPGTDPDRASFTVALETAKDQLINAAAIPDNIQTGRIRQAVLDNLLPPRRPRIAPRRVKCPISRYAAPPSQAMITGVGTVAQVTITATHSQQQAPTGRRDKTLQLMRTEPHRTWRPSEIARGIGLPEPNTHSLRTDLLRWTREGILHHHARGAYTLAPEWIQPDPPEIPETP
ncbi:transposase [Nocardia amamiensis]|uniref:Transposase n=1 Tax=Nocardia amamiensis TaxID=404578 RepID=A0ABS0D3Z8_9NOCA|nr:transposase [Nocardia amamiensis]